MKKTYLECGKIVNTHGVAGMVKIEPMCDSPEILAELETVYFKNGASYSPVTFTRTAVQKQFVLAKIRGVDDFDRAHALRGRILFAHRDDIPVEEGSHFIADLIGLPVIDAETDEIYGKIKDVRNFGAQDIYMVETPEGGEFMIPVVAEFIKNIDEETGVFVHLIEGMR